MVYPRDLLVMFMQFLYPAVLFSQIEPGTKIFIASALKQSDGSLQATRISYGRDGLTPPM